uniref:histidine phosphatase family protein n=1 Tax=Sphingobium lactosutens TaxID=522773 RepID=UPI0015BFE288
MARPCRDYTGFFFLDARAFWTDRQAASTRLEVFLTTTLVFLCVAATAMSRIGGFAGDQEPLEESGYRSAGRCKPVPSRYRIFRSPHRAAEETARAMGLIAQRAAELRDVGCGPWAGSSFADIHAREPEALAQWLRDPAAGVPDGESLSAAASRIGSWIDETIEGDGPVLAITHPMIIRAALIHMLGLPAQAALAIDIAPLSRTALSFNRIWRLQSLVPLD